MNLRLKDTGSNQARVSILTGQGAYHFHFSYETCIAFQRPGETLRVCENVWSNTTGHHLSKLDGGSRKTRIKATNFGNMLDNAFDAIALDVRMV